MNKIVQTAIASAIGSVIAFFLINELQQRRLTTLQQISEFGRPEQ